MILHQTLHGYKNGHGLLAGSILLDSVSDKAKMDMLSDWTQFKGLEGDSSYITLYPLERDFYVFAKTWYADDMQRSGCVWTHSLLIPYKDLNNGIDFSVLYNIFHKPNNEFDLQNYNSVIFINDNPEIELTKKVIQKNDVPSLGFWYDCVISGNKQVVLRIDKSSELCQKIIINLVKNIPGQILNKKYICSGSFILREYENKLFDLQLSSDLRLDAPFISSEIKGYELSDWLNIISTAILNGDNAIHLFLKNFSADIADDPKKLQNAIVVFSEIGKIEKPRLSNYKIFLHIIKELSEAFKTPEEGRTLKKVILGENIVKFFFPDSVFLSIMSIIKENKAFNYNDFNFGRRINLLLKKEKFNLSCKIIEFIIDKGINKYGQVFINSFLDVCTPERINYIILNKWHLFIELAAKDILIINNNKWIQLPKKKFEIALNIVIKKHANSFLFWDEVCQRILLDKIELPKEKKSIIYEYYPKWKNTYLSLLNNNEISLKREYYAIIKESDIIIWMKNNEVKSISIINLILEKVNPNSILVKKLGSLLWINFYEKYTEEKTCVKYYTFLFLLSSNWNDKSSFDYFKTSFNYIYVHLMKNHFPYQNWIQISKSLPKSKIEWDKCKRMRKELIKRFVVNGYNIQLLDYFSIDYKTYNKVKVLILKEKGYKNNSINFLAELD